MFRKIVTESTYSPAIAVGLNDYIRILKSQASKRQIGLIFVILAVIVQLFAVTFPSESANAHNPEALIDGGIQSMEDYLVHYDQNSKGTKDLLNSLGITRLDIETTIPALLRSTDDIFVWSLYDARKDNSHVYPFTSLEGEQKAAHYHALKPQEDPAQLAAYIGSSSTIGWFAILKASGNLVTKTSFPSACTPWSPTLAEDSISQNDPASNLECTNSLDLSLSSHNISSSTPTEPSKARSSDRISYTLLAKNSSDQSVTVPMAINIADLLEYSQLFNLGGGEFDTATSVLQWPEVAIAPGDNIERNFIVQLLPSIPSTARGEYVRSSYDCTLSASFGKTIHTPVECPFIKRIEGIVNGLPSTTARYSLAAAALLLTIATYLYLRTSQLLNELHIIRHNNLGGL